MQRFPGRPSALLDVATSIHSAPGRLAWRIGWAALLIASLVRPVRAVVVTERDRRTRWFPRPDLPSGSATAGAFLVVSVLLCYGWS